MHGRLGAVVKCPFYRRDDPRTSGLTCEGVLPGTTVKSHFESWNDLKAYQEKFCTTDDFHRCPWYRCVFRKYSDDPYDDD